MPFVPVNKNLYHKRSLLFILIIFLASCTVVKKYQKDKPIVTKNTIEVKSDNFPPAERNNLKQRLNAQLDDSSQIRVIDKYFFVHIYKNPPAYDSASAGQSARNMQASMLHLGYYKSKASFTADTSYKHRFLSMFFNVPNDPPRARVKVNYTVETGKPTLIDTVRYILRKPDLQQLAMQNRSNSLLKKGAPVTKAGVLGEINRLVDLYRNNGYYKITTEELKMRGDTTTGALTTIGGDIWGPRLQGKVVPYGGADFGGGVLAVPTANRRTTSPILIAPPSSRRTAPAIFAPLTRVPFSPKSRTYHLPSSKYTLACSRDTKSSRMTNELSRLRPMMTVLPGTNSRVFGVQSPDSTVSLARMSEAWADR